MKIELVCEALLSKGAEYYQCSRHLHLRGLSQVIRETEGLVASFKSEGITYAQVVAHLEGSGVEIGMQKDPFLAAVKSMFMDS